MYKLIEIDNARMTVVLNFFFLCHNQVWWWGYDDVMKQAFMGDESRKEESVHGEDQVIVRNGNGSSKFLDHLINFGCNNLNSNVCCSSWWGRVDKEIMWLSQ